MGSLADEAGVTHGREERRSIEATLLDVGLEQVRQEIVNVRNRSWVEVFSKWQREGI